MMIEEVGEHLLAERTNCAAVGEWIIRVARNAYPIGDVRWFARADGYAFFPSAFPTALSPDRLREIAQFCSDKTNVHKRLRRK